MPIDHEWLTPDKTILHTHTSGKYTWEEYHQQMDEIFQLIETTASIRAIIHTRSDYTDAPAGNVMPHFQKTVERFLSYPDLLIVNISSNSIARVLQRIFIGFKPALRNRVLMADSMQDAVKQIQARLNA